MTLTEFLLARIAEDEQRASAAGHGCGYMHGHNAGWVEVELPTEHNARPSYELRFIKHNSPRRVLAECEAKRSIVGLLDIAEEQFQAMHLGAADYADVARAQITRDALLRTIQLLAQPYSGHPDFDPSWAAEGQQT